MLKEPLSSAKPFAGYPIKNSNNRKIESARWTKRPPRRRKIESSTGEPQSREDQSTRALPCCMRSFTSSYSEPRRQFAFTTPKHISMVTPSRFPPLHIISLNYRSLELPASGCLHSLFTDLAKFRNSLSKITHPLVIIVVSFLSSVVFSFFFFFVRLIVCFFFSDHTA